MHLNISIFMDIKFEIPFEYCCKTYQLANRFPQTFCSRCIDEDFC